MLQVGINLNYEDMWFVEMLVFGCNEMLLDEEISDVVEYVFSIFG